MVNDVIRRARGCLIGLAIGDALGSPTEGKKITEIKDRWGRVMDFLSPDQTGTDDTEYALFSARLLLKHERRLTPEIVADTWKQEIISDTNRYQGAGFSEMLTIANLQAGLMPPLSGQHLHAWSDGLAMRVAPYGIVACGAPQLAAELAAIDGAVSHAEEGIFSGQAVAAAVAQAMSGADADDLVTAALKVIPADSWTARAIRTGVAIGKAYTNVWDALEPLSEHLVCHCYHWADLAPEAVSLAFGILTAAGAEFTTSVLGAVNVGRDADTIAAIVGAITGARVGIDALPRAWTTRISIAKGICIQTVAGMDLWHTADALGARAIEWGKMNDDY
ncbi:ADP-ribosylglycohydrolase family protein [candidate division KSB1 bacterium]|nr:ADP-ribosylglycohydrolase family protein [candidate division KSB1 bacterium]